MNGYWNFHHNRSLSHDAAHGELGEANLGLFECSAEEYLEDCGGSARAGVSGRVRQHCYPSRSPYPGVAHGGSAAACGGPQLIGRSTASVQCPANARRASRCAPPWTGQPVQRAAGRRPGRRGWVGCAGRAAPSAAAVACWDRLELVLAGRAVARLPGCPGRSCARPLVTCSAHVPFAGVPGNDRSRRCRG